MIKLTLFNRTEVFLHTGPCTRQDSQPLKSDSDLLTRHMELVSLAEGILAVEINVLNPAQDPIDNVAKGVFATPFEIAHPSCEWLGTHLIRPLVFLKNLQEAKLLLGSCQVTLLVPDAILQPTISYVMGLISPSNVSNFLSNSVTVRIRYYDATPKSSGERVDQPGSGNRPSES